MRLGDYTTLKMFFCILTEEQFILDAFIPDQIHKYHFNTTSLLYITVYI